MPAKLSPADRLKAILMAVLQQEDVKAIIVEIKTLLISKEGEELEFFILPVDKVADQAPLTSTKDSAVVPLLEKLMNAIKAHRGEGNFAVLIKMKGVEKPLFTLKREGDAIKLMQAPFNITIDPEVDGIDLDFSSFGPAFSSVGAIAALKMQLEKVLRLGGMAYDEGFISITIGSQICPYAFIGYTGTKTEIFRESYEKALLQFHALLEQCLLFPGQLAESHTHAGRTEQKSINLLASSVKRLDGAEQMQKVMSEHFLDTPALREEFFAIVQKLLVLAVYELKRSGNIIIEIEDKKFVFHFNPVNYKEAETEAFAAEYKKDIGDFAAHKARLLAIMQNLIKQKGKLIVEIGGDREVNEIELTPSKALVDSLLEEIDALRKGGPAQEALTLMRELLPAAGGAGGAESAATVSAAAEMRRITDSVKVQIAELTATKQALTAELTRKDKVTHEVRGKLAAVEAQVKELQGRLQDLLDNYNKKSALCDSLHKDLTSAVRELERVLVSTDVKARDALALQIAQLEREKSAVQAALDVASATERKLRGELGKAEAKIETLTEAATAAGARKSLLEEELLKAKSGLAQLKKSLPKALGAGDTKLSESIAKLQRDFIVLIDQLEARLKQANDKLSLIQAEVAKLQTENAALVKELACQDAEIERLNLQVAQLGQEHEQHLMQIAQLQGLLAWYAENERALTRVLTTARTEADTARARAYVLDEEAKGYRTFKPVGMTRNPQDTAIPIYTLFLLAEHIPVFANGMWGQYKMPAVAGQPVMILPLTDLRPGYMPAQDPCTGAWGQCAMEDYYKVFTPSYYPTSDTTHPTAAVSFAAGATAATAVGTTSSVGMGAGQ